MNHEMRNQRRQLTNEEILEIIKNNNYGILSTIGNDGYPYGVPLTYVYINNKFYFHSAKEGHKVENLENSSKVSFTIVGKTQLLPEMFSTIFESVIAFGEAKEVYDDEKVTALKTIIDTFSKEFKEKGYDYVEKAKDKAKVYAIEVSKITGKARKS